MMNANSHRLDLTTPTGDPTNPTWFGRLFLAALVLGACAGGTSSDTAGQTCRIGDDPRCESSTELRKCIGGVWQHTDCEQFCAQVGLTPLGCGEDPEIGLDACLCGDDQSVTTSDSGGSSGACSPPEAACEVDGDCCGAELGDAFCHAPSSSCLAACSSDAQCSSNCCLAVEGGSICAPSTYCEPTCADDYDQCNANVDCCGFADKHAFCVNDGDSALCRPTCDTDADCPSGCCALLDSGDSVCAPADICDGSPPACQDTGEACAANSDCCGYSAGDAVCVDYGGGDVVCAAICYFHGQCQSGCCAPLEDGTGACSPGQFCNSVEPFASTSPADDRARGSHAGRGNPGARQHLRSGAR